MLYQEDPVLPHLHTALDTAAMPAILQKEWLTTTGAHITACQIERVKYRPGQNCLVSYLLQIAHPASGDQEERLCAYIYPPGESQAHFAKAQQDPLPLTPWGPALWHLPALDMVVRLFPNDRKLTTLPALVAPQTLQAELLPPLVAAHWGCGWQIEAVQPQVAQYFPEHNCMVRIAAALVQPGTPDRQSAIFYAKTYYNQAGAETYRLMQALWESAERRCGCLRMAQPLAYDEARKILWQRGVPGVPLLAYENQPTLFADYLAQTASAVATLHQLPVTPLRVTTRIDWVGQLQSIAPRLARIWPDGQSRTAALLDRLLHQATAQAVEPVALLHGDLHLQNFLVEADQVTLIDLDDLALGSPWQEVGSFLASLHYRSVRTGTPVAQVAAWAAAFCQHYAAHTPWPMPATTISWYTACALLGERIARLLTRLTKGHLRDIIQLFERAETISQTL